MKQTLKILFVAFGSLTALHAQKSDTGRQWQSKLVQMDKKGDLTYQPDSSGYYIPDFSAAGYRGGGAALPTMKVVHSISPVEGDNTAHIQAAIDKVGALPLKDGIRGALLLKAGKYNISGSLYLSYDGVTLRGAGQGDSPENSTIIYATGDTPSQRTVLYVGNPKNTNKWTAGGKKVNVTDDFLPAGSKTIHLASTREFEKGDQIVVLHKATEEWLKAIGYGVGESGATPWELSSRFDIPYNRYVADVNHEDNSITLDAPIYYGFNRKLTQAMVYKMNKKNIIYECGVENLRIDCEYDTTVKVADEKRTYTEEKHPHKSLKYGNYFSDEKHAWTGLKFISVENAWAKDVTVKSIGFSGFMLNYASRSTIMDCSVIDPVSIIDGGRRYAFNNSEYSQLNLFKNCYARNSRHGYVSNGTTTASGIVFLHCKSESAYAASEGHRRWSSGFLYDNYQEIAYNDTYKHTLAFYNRGSFGSSHGWAIVTAVAWTCDLTAGDTTKGHLVVQQPPTGQNFAIGCKAAEIDGVCSFPAPAGYIEGANRAGLYPASLYEAQLNQRLKSGK
jgi:hypothetical protein